MITRIYKILFVFLLIAVTAIYPAYSAEVAPTSVIHWQNYSETIFNDAKQSNRAVFIYVGAAWCHWCLKMTNETFVNKEVIHQLETSYFPVHVDIDKDVDIAKKFQVTELPTVMIVNSDHTIKKKLTGYISPDQMLAFLNSNIPIQQSKPTTFIDKSGLSLDELMNKLKHQQMDVYKEQVQENYNNDRNLYVETDNDAIEYAMLLGAEGNRIAKSWAQDAMMGIFKQVDLVWGGVYTRTRQGKISYAKSLLSQAENLRLLSVSYQYWHNAAYILAAQSIADYVDRFLTSPDGAFYTGQSEFQSSSKLDVDYYNLNDQERRKIGVPLIDKHIYARENGLMINALCYLYFMSGNSVYLNKAIKAEQWVYRNLHAAQGGYRHEVGDTSGYYLADNLAMTRAYFQLYKATSDKRYLDLALNTMDFIERKFDGVNNLIHSEKIKADVNPSDYAMLIRIASILYHYSNNKNYLSLANNVMMYLIKPDQINKLSPASILLSYKILNAPSLKIIVNGHKDDPNAKLLYVASISIPMFYDYVEWRTGSLADHHIVSADLGKASAYVCVSQHCSLPIYNPHELSNTIEKLLYQPSEVSQTQFSLPSHSLLHQSLSLSTNEQAQLLVNKNLITVIVAFFLFGFLMAFTPCILPLLMMMLVLISNNVQEGSNTKIIRLCLTYVMTLALTYAAAGIIASVFGIYIQGYLQSPWVIVIFSSVIILLALSLFDFYDIKLPERWRRIVVRFNSINYGSSYARVIVMAILATLIMSPCAAAPLLSVLSYIGANHNIMLGGLALFSTGVGVGAPLLILATVGGRFIPKVGPWQKEIKIFIGLLLIAFSIYLLSRILLPELIMIFWSALAIFVALHLGALEPLGLGYFNKLKHVVGLIFLTYGFALLIGGLFGNTDPLRPIEFKKFYPQANTVLLTSFQRIKSMPELQQALYNARLQHKPVLLDFYAAWCESCKEFESTVLPDYNIHQLLNQFVLLKVDLTEMNKDEVGVAKQFNIIAPPAILFFDNGKQLDYFVAGSIDPDTFYSLLNQVLENSNNRR